MRRLKTLMPEVCLNVHEGVSGQLDEWLASGRVDLAITNRHMDRISKDEDLLAEVPMYLVTSSARSSCPTTVQFSRLDGTPLALPAAPSEFRQSLSEHAIRHGLTLNVVFESESVALLKDIVHSGAAATILPMSGIRSEVVEGSLHATRLVAPDFVRKITLRAAPQHRLSRAARQVMWHINALVPPLVQEASLAR
jgi:DNA-binding transcriptional LysR family regulator